MSVARRAVLTILVFLAALGLGRTVPVSAEADRATKADVGALRSDIERIRAEVDGIRGEIRLLRELLLQRFPQPGAPPQRTQAPPPVTARVKHAGSPGLGRPDAPVIVVEFSDYQSPFGKRFAETTLVLLRKEYVDTGKVRYVFRDFSLDQNHPQARKAAEAARCAGDQGRYWAMHDLLFEHQRELGVEKLKEYARRLGLDGVAFDTCLDGGRHAASVQRDHEDGLAAGLTGTPAFVVGKTGAGDTVEGSVLTGLRPLVEFRAVIDRLLGRK